MAAGVASMCRWEVWMCRDWIAAAELGFLVAAQMSLSVSGCFCWRCWCGGGLGKRQGCFGLRRRGKVVGGSRWLSVTRKPESSAQAEMWQMRKKCC